MSTSGAQYSTPIEDHAGSSRSCSVWMSVSASNISSSVPKPPGSATNAYEYLTSITLRTKKCSQRDDAVEVGVGLLLERQLDVAADRAPAGLARAAVRRLHEAGPAAGHHGEAGSRQAPRRPRAPARSSGCSSREARRAEDGDARPDEVERAEAADEVGERAEHQAQVAQARVRALEQDAIGGPRVGPVRGRGHAGTYEGPPLRGQAARTCLTGFPARRILCSTCEQSRNSPLFPHFP